MKHFSMKNKKWWHRRAPKKYAAWQRLRRRMGAEFIAKTTFWFVRLPVVKQAFTPLPVGALLYEKELWVE